MRYAFLRWFTESTILHQELLQVLCGGDLQQFQHDIFMFVEKNFRGDCSVEMLAKQMGYSENYLSRYFMKSIGVSFHSYVTQYRLEHVCHLMRNTNEPILRRAMDCGFTSLRSFNRNFGLYIGMTPTEYREQMNP